MYHPVKDIEYLADRFDCIGYAYGKSALEIHILNSIGLKKNGRG